MRGYTCERRVVYRCDTEKCCYSSVIAEPCHTDGSLAIDKENMSD